MARILYFLLLLLPSLLLATACSTTSEPGKSNASTIELDDYVAQLRKISVAIDGRSYDFLFDTGGGYTLIAPEILAAANCEPHGQLSGFRMSGEHIAFEKCGDITLQLDNNDITVEAGLFDINGLLPDKFPPLYGVISMQTFRDHAITLDLANNRLIIESDASLRERVATMTQLQANFYNELEGRGLDVYLRVDTAASETYLLLDSGNLAGNLLNPAAWQEIGNTDAPPEPGATGNLTLDFGNAGSIELPVKAADIIREGALDVNFVESAVFTFDIPNRRAWIRFHDNPMQ